MGALWSALLSLLVAVPVYADAESKEQQQVVEASDKYEGIEITVNINTASADELDTLLVGVGKKKAQDIVDYRAEHGAFKSADELKNVKGIGPSIIDKNRTRIKL
ncbi:ComEA family DNA-binding protein [Vibrio hannami]|nr:ComEA family DNA-binding protein [Vibrio hannami]MDG3087552.1 ComEA family DNA-binding protein [Vibrio hannami]